MLTDMGVDVKEPTMAADEPYTLSSEHLGALPVINFFLARMGVAEHLATYCRPTTPGGG